MSFDFCKPTWIVVLVTLKLGDEISFCKKNWITFTSPWPILKKESMNFRQDGLLYLLRGNFTYSRPNADNSFLHSSATEPSWDFFLFWDFLSMMKDDEKFCAKIWLQEMKLFSSLYTGNWFFETLWTWNNHCGHQIIVRKNPFLVLINREFQNEKKSCISLGLPLSTQVLYEQIVQFWDKFIWLVGFSGALGEGEILFTIVQDNSTL